MHRGRAAHAGCALPRAVGCTAPRSTFREACTAAPHGDLCECNLTEYSSVTAKLNVKWRGISLGWGNQAPAEEVGGRCEGVPVVSGSPDVFHSNHCALWSKQCPA
jgi:hypothetical protein